MNVIQVGDKGRAAGFLTITKFRNGEAVWKSEPLPNKIVSSSGYGRNLLIRQLAGDTSYPLEIDSAAIGDDDTAPTDSDTDLGNSLVSGISITNKTVSNDSIQVDVFVADADLPADDYKEFGLYCGGRLFARIILSTTYSKADGEDSLFSYTGTLTG